MATFHLKVDYERCSWLVRLPEVQDATWLELNQTESSQHVQKQRVCDPVEANSFAAFSCVISESCSEGATHIGRLVFYPSMQAGKALFFYQKMNSKRRSAAHENRSQANEIRGNSNLNIRNEQICLSIYRRK